MTERLFSTSSDIELVLTTAGALALSSWLFITYVFKKISRKANDQAS